jgi:hypothetical protein
MEEDFKRMLTLLKEVEQSGDDREDEPPLKQLSLF